MLRCRWGLNHGSREADFATRGRQHQWKACVSCRKRSLELDFGEQVHTGLALPVKRREGS